MPRYRKKPVEIEARHYPGLGTREAAQVIADWCGGRVRSELAVPTDPDSLQHVIEIRTLEGTMTASPGYWVIRGVQGEFYPCKPDIFDATYDEIPEEQHA